MSGAIPPLPQYAFMAWYLVKAQGHLYLHLYRTKTKPDTHYVSFNFELFTCFIYSVIHWKTCLVTIYKSDSREKERENE
jgi:hypothetical protein